MQLHLQGHVYPIVVKLLGDAGEFGQVLLSLVDDVVEDLLSLLDFELVVGLLFGYLLEPVEPLDLPAHVDVAGVLREDLERKLLF